MGCSKCTTYPMNGKMDTKTTPGMWRLRRVIIGRPMQEKMTMLVGYRVNVQDSEISDCGACAGVEGSIGGVSIDSKKRTCETFQLIKYKYCITGNKG